MRFFMSVLKDSTAENFLFSRWNIFPLKTENLLFILQVKLLQTYWSYLLTTARLIGVAGIKRLRRLSKRTTFPLKTKLVKRPNDADGITQFGLAAYVLREYQGAGDAGAHAADLERHFGITVTGAKTPD